MWKNVGQIKLTGPRKTVENRNKLIFTKTLHRADLHNLDAFPWECELWGPTRQPPLSGGPGRVAAARSLACFSQNPLGRRGQTSLLPARLGGGGGALSLRSRRTLSEAPTMPAPRPPGRRRPGFHANRGGRAAAASGSRLHGGRQAWRRGSGNSGDRQTDTTERRRFTAELPCAWAPRSG